MNKKNLPIYFSLALVLGILIGVLFGGNSDNLLSFSNPQAKEQKIKKLINFIEQDYVDKVDTENLLDGAITQILTKLDPHSRYIPKENLQDETNAMLGSFVGIGVMFKMIKDSMTVVQPIKGGPSIKAGILAGDRILMSNKDTLFGKDYRTGAVPKYLKGKPNTNVALQVYRKSNDSLFTVNVTRGKVNVKSVDLTYMINDSIGYIRLNRFAANSFREFKVALNNLTDDGMTDLVLDLRGNGGGIMSIAIRIVDEFLDKNKLIVFTKNNKDQINESFSTSIGSFEKGGLYVLIDEGSASASEIVAGALQDNDKGTIIGRRSFGKGLVQIDKDLGDGSAVRLTIARYYTPTGRSIQKPYDKNGNKDYSRDYQKRINSGELLNRDSIKVIDSLKYKTPKGKIVYGGGGIIPDVFVAIDTSAFMSSSFYLNSVNNFAFDYVDTNRKQLKKWTVDSFIAGFDLNEVVLDRCLSKMNDRTDPSLNTRESIKKYLKAAVANVLFGDLGFYKIMHQDDKMLLKVLELEKSN
jgi:carboxyl-terminal processing protease